MAELFVSINGTDEPPRPIELTNGLTVGRSEKCDIAAEDRHLSRIHCRFESDGDAWFIVDCDSTNGTRIGAQKIDRRQLIDGDFVNVGPLRILFRDEATARFESEPIENPDDLPVVANQRVRPGKPSSSDTILDGIIATGSQSPSRFAGNSRKSPPRIKPRLIDSMRKTKSSKGGSLSIADLTKPVPPPDENPAERKVDSKNDVSAHEPFVANDSKGHRNWFLSATEFFRRRML